MPKARSAKNARQRSRQPTSAPVKRKKLSKRLEKLARAIKDSEDFIGHMTGLRDRYRREHVLSEGTAQSAVRQATRALHKHATALSHWLQQANQSSSNTMEREALDKLGDPALRPLTPPVLDWLSRASAAATQRIASTSRRRDDSAALRVAAEGLRAIFEHHKLKLSTAGSNRQPAGAVLLLCAIAHDAGDVELKPDTAKAALRQPHRTARPNP